MKLKILLRESMPERIYHTILGGKTDLRTSKNYIKDKEIISHIDTAIDHIDKAADIYYKNFIENEK